MKIPKDLISQEKNVYSENQFQGITLADPFWRGRLIFRDKNGDEFCLKRHLLIWGKLKGKRAIMKIIRVPTTFLTLKSSYELRENLEKDFESSDEGYKYQCENCNKKFKTFKEAKKHDKVCKSSP